MSRRLQRPSFLQRLTPAGFSLSLGLPPSLLLSLSFEIIPFPGESVKETRFTLPLHIAADDSMTSAQDIFPGIFIFVPQSCERSQGQTCPMLYRMGEYPVGSWAPTHSVWGQKQHL